ECYRKQGRTNEAAAQYERIAREFADQSTLVDLSRQNLAGLGAPAKAVAVSGAEPITNLEAEEVQKIREIIANSPDLINARGNQGTTRLQQAATAGQLSVVRFLLANGADVNATDRSDNTAIFWAAGNGHKAVVEALLAGGAKIEVGESSALQAAARN